MGLSSSEQRLEEGTGTKFKGASFIYSLLGPIQEKGEASGLDIDWDVHAADGWEVLLPLKSASHRHQNKVFLLSGSRHWPQGPSGADLLGSSVPSLGLCLLASFSSKTRQPGIC